MKLFIATPMYGGQCYGAYTDSVIKLCVELSQRGIAYQYFPIFNESHIDRARNVSADEFLRTDSTHLLFIDSDISGYKAEQVIDLIAFDKPVICGFYPKKRINWKTIVQAVKSGLVDEEDPDDLAYFVGDMVFTPALNADSNRARTIHELTELHEGGTGFMLIQRRVLERLTELHPERRYHRHHDRRDLMCAFFDAQPDPEWQVNYRRFMTEDFDFCRIAREAGFGIWLAPWIKLTHHGYYQFIGDIEAISLARMEAAKQEKQAKEAA